MKWRLSGGGEMKAKGKREESPIYPNLGVGSATGVPLRGEGFALGYPRSARLDWRGVRLGSGRVFRVESAAENRNWLGKALSYRTSDHTVHSDNRRTSEDWATCGLSASA